MPALNIIFAGTPMFAAQHLQAIKQHGQHHLSAVLTQPDRPRGRGKKALASPVKTLAQEFGIEVLQPQTLKANTIQSILTEYEADLMIVVAYGLILPAGVLSIPRLGCINVHASLLPRWRGAAPIERALQAGDTETGISIMQMDIGLDDGPVITQQALNIEPHDTGDSLRQRMAQLGSNMLIDTLQQLATNDTLSNTPQDHSKANYAHKLKKSEAALDWQCSAQTLALQIRAFNSQNVCFFTLQHDDQSQRIRVWEASALDNAHSAPTSVTAGTIGAVNKHSFDVICADNSLLRIEKMQLPGGKVLSVHAILNSRANWFSVGTQLH